MKNSSKRLLCLGGVLAGVLFLSASLEEKVAFAGSIFNPFDPPENTGYEFQPVNSGSQSSNTVKLRNKNWGRCLNLQSATQNGVTTNAWDCVSHPDQEWKIEEIGNGFVKIRNKNWGKCLNLQSATQNGVAVNSWECAAHPDQEWKIE